MRWHLSLISTPSLDTDLSLAIVFDHARYIINCGEGTQRVCNQRGVGFKKLEGVFLTSGSGEAVGGLPGVLMSAADSGMENINIAGPESALHHLVSCRTFVQREKFSVNWLPHPHDPSNPTFSRAHLSVKSIPLPPSSSSSPSLSSSSSALLKSELPQINQDWEWRDLDLKLNELTVEQLAGWRRTILEDMFKAPGRHSTRPEMSLKKPDVEQVKEVAEVQEAERDGDKGEKMEVDAAETDKPIPENDTSPADDPVLTTPASATESASNATIPPNATTADGHIPKPIRQYHPARMHFGQAIPHPTSVSSSDPDLRYAYIFQAPLVRGKFDKQKAVALGVPNGAIRKELIEGRSIEVEVEVADEGVDGGKRKEKRVIKPEDVMGETQDGGAFIMVDITSIHLPALFASSDIKEYQLQADGTQARQAAVVVHRVTDEVAKSEEYQSWMKAFGEKTQHLVANIDRWEDTMTHTSSAWNLLRLNMLDTEIFKMPVFDEPNSEKPVDIAGTTTVKPYLTTRIYPTVQTLISPPYSGDPSFPIGAEAFAAAQASVVADIPKYGQMLEQMKGDKKSGSGDVEMDADGGLGDHHGIVLTPLGTGSAIPSKYRNVSCTIVDIPSFGVIILDAGEGSYGQLLRRYGREGASQLLARTKIIFVSHMHADHHLGITRMLLAQRQSTDTPVYLIAPSFVALHLRENGIDVEATEGIRFIDNYFLVSGIQERSKDSRSRSSSPKSRSPSPRPNKANDAGQTNGRYEVASGQMNAWQRSRTTMRDCLKDLDLTKLHAPEVKHRGRAYGFAVTHRDGWKIAYSGDTMPCDALVEAGNDATLLIHEATLEDDKPEMAEKKGHSTFGQAIDIGRRMKAKYVLLNHFSQRYPKTPSLQPTSATTSDSYQPKVALAVDLMQIPLRDFERLATYSAAIETLFEETVEDEVDEATDELKEMAVAPKGNGKSKQKSKPATASKGSEQAEGRKVSDESGKRKRQPDGTTSPSTRQPKRTKSGNLDTQAQSNTPA